MPLEDIYEEEKRKRKKQEEEPEEEESPLASLIPTWPAEKNVQKWRKQPKFGPGIYGAKLSRNRI